MKEKMLYNMHCEELSSKCHEPLTVALLWKELIRHQCMCFEKYSDLFLSHCVSVCDRERQRDKERDREIDGERQGDRWRETEKEISFTAWMLFSLMCGIYHRMKRRTTIKAIRLTWVLGQ